jgi:hypothetical protein
MDLNYVCQQYFTCMCFLGSIRYSKTFIHPRVSYSPRALPSGNMILLKIQFSCYLLPPPIIILFSCYLLPPPIIIQFSCYFLPPPIIIQFNCYFLPPPIIIQDRISHLQYQTVILKSKNGRLYNNVNKAYK